MKIIREDAAARLAVLVMQWRNAPEKAMPGAMLLPDQHGPLRHVAARYRCKAQLMAEIVALKKENNIAGMVRVTPMSPEWHAIATNPDNISIAKNIAGFVHAGRVYV